MILCSRIADLPTSVNELYERTKWGVRKNDKGRAFQNRCAGVVRDLMAARRFRKMPPNVGWQLRLVFWLPELETAAWRTKGDTHQRFVNRDVDNFQKLVVDSVFRAMDRDDRSVVRLVVDKRDGYGSGWIDFMVREVPVADTKNNTELTQIINDRRNLVRASPSDPLLLLEDLAERPDNGTDYRLTNFDAWRTEIMTRLLSVFSQVQARLPCPARTGKLNACFGCSDMMVIHCVMSNPQTLDRKGKAIGVFDLSQQKTGTYRSTVDRPQGGEGMEDQKRPAAAYNDVVLMLSEAETDYRNMAKALKATYDILKGAKNTPGSQDILVKLAVILTDALEAGPGKCPARSILYYRDITPANMPESIQKAITAVGGAYQYCANLYGKLRTMYADWAGTGGTTTTAPAKKEAPEVVETAEEEAEADTDTEVEARTEEPEEAPVVPRARTRVKPAPAPTPIEDASVEDAGPEDTPKVNPIEPDAPTKITQAATPALTDEDIADEDVDIALIYKEIRNIREGQRKLGQALNAILAYLRAKLP